MKGILCPYCGNVSLNPKRCDGCGGFFDPLSRQASQNAMGPWFIRDGKSPFRPGCSFETVRELVKRGKITRETVIRGPATRQFWNFAGRTPTVANLLGVCHNCGGDVGAEDFSCGACGAVFTPETDRQHLGLAPVHLLPGQATPEIIAAASGAPERKREPKRYGAGGSPKGVRNSPWVLTGLGIGVLFAIGAVGAYAVWTAGVGEKMWAEVTGAEADVRSAETEVPEPAATSADEPTAEARSSDDTAATGAETPPDAGPTTTTVEAPTAPVALDELGAVRTTLAAGTDFDERELMGRLERLEQKPGLTAEARALEELVVKRAEMGRLKRLP